MVRKNLLQVADRNSGPLATFPNNAQGYDYAGLTGYLEQVKARFPTMTAASILLEPDTPYDTLVQVMDHVRVFETSDGLQTLQAQLFPDISVGDAPPAAPVSAQNRGSEPVRPMPARKRPARGRG
jgi:hypothetical protein